MLHVLRDYCKKKLIDADCHTDPAQALTALSSRFSAFDADYSCVVLGWTDKQPAGLENLLLELSGADHKHLPLVVLCQHITGEVRAIARRRAATRVLLWRDYQQLAQQPGVDGEAAMQTRSHHDLPIEASEWRMLFIDNEPSVSIALCNAASKAGHGVEVAPDIETALHTLDDQPGFDLIAIDHALCRESDVLAARLRALVDRCALVLLADSLSNSVSIQGSEIGAVACLDKSESPAILCQRLDALLAMNDQKTVELPVQPIVETVDQTVPIQQLVSAIDSPILIVDQTDGIVVASRGAQALLGAVADKAFADIAGQSLENTQQASGEAAQLTLTPLQGEPLAVSWQLDSVDIDGMEQLQLFSFVQAQAEPEPKEELVSVVPSVRRGEILGTHELNEAIEQQLQLTSGCQALLLLNIEIVAVSGDRMDLGSSEPMLRIVRGALANVYKAERSLAYLGNGQFAFLLSTSRLQDALVLSRKLLQIIPRMVRYADSLKLVSHGALLRYDETQVKQSAEQVLQQCVAGCETSRSRGDDLVYVIHMNQWLRAQEKKPQQRTDPLAAPV